MAHSRKNKLKTLRRRYDFLMKRSLNGEFPAGSYDEAEASALKWAIDTLEEQLEVING